MFERIHRRELKRRVVYQRILPATAAFARVYPMVDSLIAEPYTVVGVGQPREIEFAAYVVQHRLPVEANLLGYVLEQEVVVFTRKDG